MIKQNTKIIVKDYNGKEKTAFVSDERFFDKQSPLFDSPVFEATDTNGNPVLARKKEMRVAE